MHLGPTPSRPRGAVRLGAALFAATASWGCSDPGPEEPRDDGPALVTEDPSDLPIAGATPKEQERFLIGDALFENPTRASQGLGPLYIRIACSSCHADDGRGPGFVEKMVVVEDDGITPAADQSKLPWGHTVRPYYTAGASIGIVPPEDDPSVRVSRRMPPPTFGRGYLEAIADEEIERVEAEQASRTDGISGRIHRVSYASEPNPETAFHAFTKGQEGLIGRFGLKARIATLDEFAADALQGDMGMTSPLRPDELPNPEGLDDDEKEGTDLDLEAVNAVADYTRLLAIPKRAEAIDLGAAAFEKALCSACHVPSMRTRADYPIAALAGIDAPVYTDLLLHDMGDHLADGPAEGDASPREWRTPPLIGLRFVRDYLHDGRAKTLEEAILAHAGPGSEANASVAAFEALGVEDRTALLELVSRL